MESEHKSELIIEAIREKKGKEITTIDLSKVENAICDRFVICHGDSVTQVGAITESIEKKLKESGSMRAHHVEGLRNSQWVLMDYFDVLVHVFLKEYRAFYNLEERWVEGRVMKLEDA